MRSKTKRRRSRGSMVAPRIAPVPTHPISSPKLLSDSPSRPSATTGRSAQSALADTENAAPRRSTVRTGGEKRTNRMPARTAGANRSPDARTGPGGRTLSATSPTIITSRPASTANSAPALSAAMIRPATAGPIARARLIATPLSATAASSSERGTKSWVSAW